MSEVRAGIVPLRQHSKLQDKKSHILYLIYHVNGPLECLTFNICIHDTFIVLRRFHFIFGIISGQTIFFWLVITYFIFILAFNYLIKLLVYWKKLPVEWCQRCFAILLSCSFLCFLNKIDIREQKLAWPHYVYTDA